MKKLLGIFGILIGLMTFVKVQTGIGTMTPVIKFQVEVSTTDPLNSGSTANGKIIPPNVDYSKLTPILFKAIQECLFNLENKGNE